MMDSLSIVAIIISFLALGLSALIGWWTHWSRFHLVVVVGHPEFRIPIFGENRDWHTIRVLLTVCFANEGARSGQVTDSRIVLKSQNGEAKLTLPAHFLVDVTKYIKQTDCSTGINEMDYLESGWYPFLLQGRTEITRHIVFQIGTETVQSGQYTMELQTLSSEKPSWQHSASWRLPLSESRINDLLKGSIITFKTEL